MWETSKFEKLVRDRLVSDFETTRGEEIYSDYVNARKVVVEEIIPEIKSIEPSLTDHGPEHIRDVMDNAHILLDGNTDGPQGLDGINLYCLAMAILFHDVGNVSGREKHWQKISEIYEVVRRSDERFRQEKFIVLKAAEAHAGTSQDGSRDTLKHVPLSSNLYKKEVRLRDIAAILRFADELAEGPQRTSRYMQVTHMYSTESLIYHRYSNIVNIRPDRGNSRIAMTLNINVNAEKNQAITAQEIEGLKELLRFAYRRIEKLDQERKYNKFYCNLLSAFKATEVVMNFWLGGELIDLKLKGLILSDIVVPGDKLISVSELDPSYDIAAICKMLTERQERGSGEQS